MADDGKKRSVMAAPGAPAGVHVPYTRRSKFQPVANTYEEEMAYDLVGERKLPKPCGVIASVAHLVKGALGGGIMGGHVGYLHAGVAVGVFFNVLIGFYLTYCLHILVKSSQILYRRTRIPTMSYPDVGEASFSCSSKKCLFRWAKAFRYYIDFTICLDLFGSCSVYQLMISKNIKQVVENVSNNPMAACYSGYPNLRIYLTIMIIPCILICLLRHLQYLAPFSVVANFFIVCCIVMTIYFAFLLNPTFSGMTLITDVKGFFKYTGMVVFSMSCSGVVIPVENNMKDPSKFPRVLMIGMSFIVTATILSSFFGYTAFRENSEAPITINFPMSWFTKTIKILIAIMIYVTHALNFWVPFNLVFYYLKKLHPENKRVMWEYIYRAFFVLCVSLVAIAFPKVNDLMGFLGCFCLSNMAFIWPNLIYLLVIMERPGFGPFRWRLWMCMVFLMIGLILFIAGSFFSVQEMIIAFQRPENDTCAYVTE